jgi:hypothetical protein
MAELQGDALCHVHAGAAADPQNDIGLKGAKLPDAGFDSFGGQISLRLIEDPAFDAQSLDGRHHFFEMRIAAHAFIGANQGFLSDAGRYCAQSFALARTDDHGSRQAKRAKKVFHFCSPLRRRQHLEIGKQLIIEFNAILE